MMLVKTGFKRTGKRMFLFSFMACLVLHASAAPVQIVSEAPLANAKITEIQHKGSTYIGEHFIGIVGDTIELSEGTHKLSLGAPNHYIFEFTISVGKANVTIRDVSIRPENCSPELKASWADPKAILSKKGTAIVVLPMPHFGLPTGGGWCARPLLVPCDKRKIALDIRTTPPGAEIWINGEKQPSRTNQLVETELELCQDAVNVLLRLPGMPNCDTKVLLTGTSKSNVTCDFFGIAKKWTGQ